MLGNNSPASLGRVLGQSAAPSILTGTLTETTLATITVPASAIGPNGWVAILLDITQTASQTVKVKFGGTQLFNVGSTTTGYIFSGAIANRGATNSQRFVFMQINTGTSTAQGQTGPAAIDTTASADITVTGTLTNVANNIRLESYQVILYPKG